MSLNITIATCPCSWGVWWADGTPSKTPYNVFLDQASESGYKELELGPDGYLPTNLDDLNEELEKRNLAICSGTACYSFDLYECFEDFKDQVDDLCKRISQSKAKYLVTMDESDVGMYSEKKKDFDKATWEKYFKMLKKLGEYTKQTYDIETVYHPHIKSLIETEEEIYNLMKYTNLNLCLDIGHHAYVNGKGSVIDFIRKNSEKIKYLHFKNVDPNIMKQVIEENICSDTAFDMDVMGDLETGIVDYENLKTVLDEINYSGIGVIEQDMPNATTKEAFDAAKRNLDYLKRIEMI